MWHGNEPFEQTNLESMCRTVPVVYSSKGVPPAWLQAHGHSAALTVGGSASDAAENTHLTLQHLEGHALDVSTYAFASGSEDALTAALRAGAGMPRLVLRHETSQLVLPAASPAHTIARA